MAALDALKVGLLRQIQKAGRKGVLIRHGMHTMTHEKLVEDGMIWQEHGASGYWKFTLSPTGKAALTSSHETKEGRGEVSDEEITCCACGKETSREYFMCDEIMNDEWCPDCFEQTDCGQGKHGEGCPTKAFGGR
jgi:hypothetical protein